MIQRISTMLSITLYSLFIFTSVLMLFASVLTKIFPPQYGRPVKLPDSVLTSVELYLMVTLIFAIYGAYQLAKSDFASLRQKGKNHAAD